MMSFGRRLIAARKRQPHDDQRLVYFLRQHRPLSPPPKPNLSEQLMQAIASTQASGTGAGGWKAGRSQQVCSAAIAGDRLLTRPKPSAIELVRLEAFMESNWDGVVGDRRIVFLTAF